MDISARNSLKGAVKRVLPGAVNTEVTVELANGLEVAPLCGRFIPRKACERRIGTAHAQFVYSLRK